MIAYAPEGIKPISDRGVHNQRYTHSYSIVSIELIKPEDVQGFNFKLCLKQDGTREPIYFLLPKGVENDFMEKMKVKEIQDLVGKNVLGVQNRVSGSKTLTALLVAA